ncbi:alanine racemase [Nocardioides sp.]|uniref:alanine racemase n=1 Tax=Nocardioides sp. TaxID=35761 RepID=UPI003514B951
MTATLGTLGPATGTTRRPAPAPLTPQVSLDPAAVRHNVRTLQAHTHAALMAVVKADGFGLGAAALARAALDAGAQRLGVATLAEARALRAAGVRVPLLCWLWHADDVVALAAAVRSGVEVAVADLAHLAAVCAFAPGARVHLHLDTGLGRDGAEPERWDALVAAARSAELAGRVHVVGVMGHLAEGARPDAASTRHALALMTSAVARAEAVGLRPRWRHLAATAATLHVPAAHGDVVRVGAGLVGIDPAGGGLLRPAGTLRTPILTVRAVRAGTGVGYGHTWVAAHDTRLGLLPLGYADGLPATAPGVADVLVGRRRRPLVATCMDMAVVDLGAPDPRAPGVEQEAVVWGPGDHGEPTPRDWAGWAAVLEHQVLTGLGTRVRRVSSGAR